MGSASGAGAQVREYHEWLRYMRISPGFSGVGVALGETRKTALTARRKSSVEWPFRSLTRRL